MRTNFKVIVRRLARSVAFLGLLLPIFGTDVSAQISESIAIAVAEAKVLSGKAPDGWTRALEILERGGEAASPAERYLLGMTAGSIARLHAAFERALSNYRRARTALEGIEGVGEQIAEITEIEAGILLELDRTEDAANIFQNELSRSRSLGEPPNPAAAHVAALLLAHAMESGDQ